MPLKIIFKTFVLLEVEAKPRFVKESLHVSLSFSKHHLQ